MAGANDIRDTDAICLDRELRRQLEGQLIESGSCHIVENHHTRSLTVRLRCRHTRRGETPRMSIIRIAWAFANPNDHLTEEEFAVHTCQNTGDDETPICCNGAHLRKGTRDDVLIANAARKKGFLDR